MYTLLWLLLPVAAASGWFVARQSQRQTQPPHHQISPEYFKGLNFLLNEQPDKAIDVFTKLLEADDPEAIDTHMAVGSLFRRRGEVDRAIRLHQNLLTLSSLSSPQKSQALLELGHDYLRAGLLDRAEGLLLDLIEVDKKCEAGLRLLKAIYQQEKEWHKAAEVVQQLEATTGENLAHVLAQYHCELAEEAKARRDMDVVKTCVVRALNCDPMCVRASILRGNVQREEAEYEAAITSFQKVAEQDPDFLSEVIDPMLDCHYELDRLSEMAEYLQEILRKFACTKAVLVFSELLRQEHGDHDSAVFMANYLGKTPSLQGLCRLVELNLSDSAGELRDTFRVIRMTLERMIKKVPKYKCEQCGFSGKSLHWLCPSCKTWNSVKPVQSLIADSLR